MTTPNWYTINTCDFTASADRQTNIVTYADNLTPEQAIEHVAANLDRIPTPLRPIVQWALTEPNRPRLLTRRNRGGLGEGSSFLCPYRDPAAIAAVSDFGTVDRYGFFYFNHTAKIRALTYLKQQCHHQVPGYEVPGEVARRGQRYIKSNASHYAVDLADLGMVIIEKPRKNFGQKPWLVRYNLPTHSPSQPAPNPPYFLPAHVIPAMVFGGEE